MKAIVFLAALLTATPCFAQEGVASFYGRKEHGGPTASGERFNMHANTCAHRTLPLHTMIKVTNLVNGRETTCRINDRGPYAGKRILDASYKVAQDLDFIGAGLARVRIDTNVKN